MGALGLWRGGPADPASYRNDLDGLRAVAVVLVMLAHAGQPWSNGGNAGVTAFFVLSGFLITGILQAELTRTGRVDLMAFYRRRIRRLAPALLVLLAATTVVWILAGGSHQRLLPILGSLLYINNWLEVLGVPMEPLPHTWTLAIEEQFYLLWPLALIVLKLRRALIVALTLAAASAVMRVATDGTFEYFSTLTRADAILVGSALALIGRPAFPPIVAFLGVLGLVAISLTDASHDLAIAMAIVSASAVVTSRLPALGVLAPIGRRAYSLYLWNWPLTLIFGTAGFVLTFAVGELSYRLAERPFMRARTPSAARPGRRTPVRVGWGRPQRPVLLTGVILASLLVASCSVPSAATPTAAVAASPTPRPCPSGPEPTTCVLVLGDSIAAGEGASGADRWPARLEALLRQDLPDRNVVVSNWAQAGSEIDLLESRVAELPIESYQVAIVITGWNDAAVRSMDEWSPRYVAALDVLEEAGVKVVIGTAPPTFEAGVFTDRRGMVAETLRGIAGDRPMLDIAKVWQELGAEAVGGYYVDGVHQNKDGQAVIAERARALVDKILGHPID